jgi:DNA-binding MarR family transcriptional regulator
MSLTRATAKIASECLCRRARALSRQITAVYDEALRGTGLTANQLTVLVAVERTGEIAPVDLGRLLGMEKSTVSRTAARMIGRGWLTEHPASGRRRALTTTAAGRERIREAYPMWRQAQNRTRTALGGDFADALVSTTRQ